MTVGGWIVTALAGIALVANTARAIWDWWWRPRDTDGGDAGDGTVYEDVR